jgi:hypothetical protein
MRLQPTRDVVAWQAAMSRLDAAETLARRHDPHVPGRLDQPGHQRPADHRSRPHQARRSVPVKRLVRPALGAVLLLALAATPALANHSHVKLLGNGQCVVLAEGAGEDDVILPMSVFEHNPNVDVSSAGPAHPLHVLVHKGVPGDHGWYAVYGSEYGNELCKAGYVNR